MRRRWWRTAVGSVLLAVPIFPIPGLAGRTLSVGGDARTSTGGAVIAASENGGNGSATRHVVVARLDTDGTVDLAYGTRGIATAGLGNGDRATAVAINPASGAAWVGVRTASGASEIVALDGRGNRVKAFGVNGVVRLPARLSGGPRALLWRPGRLFVAAGTQPCAGCVDDELDPTTGRTVSTASGSGQGSCPTRSITSAVFGRSGNVVLGTATAPHCAAVILTFATSGHGGSLSVRPVPGAHTVTLAGSAPNTCQATTVSGGIAIGPFAANQPIGPPAHRGPAGRLIGLTSLGGNACAALIYPYGAHHAVVIQSGSSGRTVTTTTVPGRLQPLAISRCNQHLLVIGDQPSGGSRTGEVAVVPVREGPHAATARATARAASVMPSAATCRSA